MKGTVNIILITCDFIVKAEVHVSLKLKVISEQVASSFVFEKASPTLHPPLRHQLMRSCSGN